MMTPRTGCTLALLAALASPARAELNTVDVTFNIFDAFFGTIPSVTARARLDFELNIEKMLFLRVGTGGSHSGGASGTGPAASASVSEVSLNLTPVIPAGGFTPPATANNQPVAWNGAAPTFAAATLVVVPVEVRSNAGPVRISGQATTALTSGAFTLPMSTITIVSSDPANLPAPSVPNTGPGPAVNVTTGGSGTAAAPTILTQRSANWTFGFTGATPAPGSYAGVITFTATSL